jgi:hypothetical protein
MMGLGRAVIITAGDETARFPPGTCLRLDHDAAEQETLEALMLWLCQNREAAREIGARAARYIREHHGLDEVAARYWQVLSDARD